MTERPTTESERTPYRRLVQEAEDMLYMLDPEGQYVLVNDSFVETTGYDREELLGATPAKLLSETDYQKGQRRVERLIAADERRTDTYTVDLITADERRVPCEIRFTLLPPKDGRYAGMVGVCRDVHERRRRQQKLQVMTRVLRHNLRNKLGVVMGEAELLRTRADDGSPPDLATIEEATETIERTADDLVRLSEKVRTIQSGIRSRGEGPARIDLATVARKTVAQLGTRFPEARIRYDGPTSVWAAATDSFGVALSELVENGVEHYEGAGQPVVEVTVRQGEERVDVEVTDRCPRIPDAEKRVIRSERETALDHSAGVGLWLVYWVIRAAGADISFEYDGDGNRIVLEFDAAAPP